MGEFPPKVIGSKVPVGAESALHRILYEEAEESLT